MKTLPDNLKPQFMEGVGTVGEAITRVDGLGEGLKFADPIIRTYTPGGDSNRSPGAPDNQFHLDALRDPLEASLGRFLGVLLYGIRSGDNPPPTDVINRESYFNHIVSSCNSLELNPRDIIIRYFKGSDYILGVGRYLLSDNIRGYLSPNQVLDLKEQSRLLNCTKQAELSELCNPLIDEHDRPLFGSGGSREAGLSMNSDQYNRQSLEELRDNLTIYLLEASVNDNLFERFFVGKSSALWVPQGTLHRGVVEGDWGDRTVSITKVFAGRRV